MRMSWLALVLLFAVTRDALAQLRTFSDSSNAALTTALVQGRANEAINALSRECDPDLKRARSDSTVALRRGAAVAAMACYRLTSATITAMAPPERAFQVRALLDAGAAPFEAAAAEMNAQQEFGGLKWGVGIGASFSRQPIIDDAVLVDDTVRVRSDRTNQPRLLLEYHKLFWCKATVTGTRGCGPFVVAAATDQKALAGAGAGFMWGWRASRTDADGFAIGVGVLLDGNVKSLARGFRADEAAPAGATEVAFANRSRTSWLVFATRTF